MFHSGSTRPGQMSLKWLDAPWRPPWPPSKTQRTKKQTNNTIKQKKRFPLNESSSRVDRPTFDNEFDFKRPIRFTPESISVGVTTHSGSRFLLGSRPTRGQDPLGAGPKTKNFVFVFQHFFDLSIRWQQRDRSSLYLGDSFSICLLLYGVCAIFRCLSFFLFFFAFFFFFVDVCVCVRVCV